MTSILSSSNNKLLAHKSAFQAWKCVAFGCSLLAMILLLSKWYEVSTDLQLLLSIDRLISSNSQATSSTTKTTAAAASVNNSGSSEVLSWPPVPLEVLLPAPNETRFGMESMENNGTMLMSHMHMSLSRELNGNQLLRAEIEAFSAEFRTAKSTLSLSSLLVSVYIVSWILMTLAINDTRISNDISLRNILLLSVFGAIDMAASVGFVMVRLIMYSVKNHSFANEMLAIIGLKDAPVRLSADQLTAFTALRLIGMRSCSAYVDIYVSVLIALLTLLRLYAILRALTYYKHLRRITDFQQMLQQQQQQQQQQHQQHVTPGNITNGTGPPDMAEQKPHIWSTTFYGASNNHLMNSTPTPSNRQHNVHHTSPQHDYRDRHFRSASKQAANKVTSSDTTLAKSGTFKFHQVGSVRPSASRLILGSARATADGDSQDDLTQVLQLRATAEGDQKAGRSSQQHNHHQHHHDISSSTLKKSSRNHTKLNLISPPIRRDLTSSQVKVGTISGKTNLLVVNGRKHRIVQEERPGERQSKAEEADESVGESNEQHVLARAEEISEGGSSMIGQEQQLLFNDLDGKIVGGGGGAKQVNSRESAASDQELLCSERRRKRSIVGLPAGYNTVRSNGTTYTLLSAQQFDKLGRKLAVNSSAGNGSTVRGASTPAAATKYKLVARYKPVLDTQVVSGDLQRIHRENSLPDDQVSSASSSSASSTTSASSSASSTCNPAEDSDGSAMLANLAVAGNAANSRQRRQPRLLGVRHSEEVVADMMRHKVFEVADSNQNLLLGKCAGYESGLTNDEIIIANKVMNNKNSLVNEFPQFPQANRLPSLVSLLLPNNNRRQMDENMRLIVSVSR